LHDAAPLAAVLCATLHSISVCAHVLCVLSVLASTSVRVHTSVSSMFVCRQLNIQTCPDANGFLCLKASFVQ